MSDEFEDEFEDKRQEIYQLIQKLNALEVKKLMLIQNSDHNKDTSFVDNFQAILMKHISCKQSVSICALFRDFSCAKEYTASILPEIQSLHKQIINNDNRIKSLESEISIIKKLQIKDSNSEIDNNEVEDKDMQLDDDFLKHIKKKVKIFNYWRRFIIAPLFEDDKKLKIEEKHSQCYQHLAYEYSLNWFLHNKGIF